LLEAAVGAAAAAKGTPPPPVLMLRPDAPNELMSPKLRSAVTVE